MGGLALLGPGSNVDAVQSAPSAESAQHDGSELVMRSLGLLGVEYRFGGSLPATGLDCSGFVRHVYREALGIDLPRRAEDMSLVGESIKRDQLRPGDLVFFNTMKRPASHVGLYLGNGQFVHAPSTGNVIRVDAMSVRYWSERFENGRRIAASGTNQGPDREGLDRLILARSQESAAESVARAELPAQRSVEVAIMRVLAANVFGHSNH